ncbi:MAG: ABC transporter ATP-binding protein [Acutalibacteraceae bacterium]|jgi:iron complex transport system ATP-binding protein|nr:ABC transporter ATP-binding protein [Clostridiales bacterium]
MINVRDISFSYDDKLILDNISFDIEQNHCIAVLGNNGAGKSTLIKCLNRINKPQNGYVLMGEDNLFDLHRNELAKRVGYVAQKNELSRMTVFDSILLGRKPYIKWEAQESDFEIVESVIKTLNLTDFKMRFIDELSGGEFQKVMLARALAQQPKLLLLDEPTSNLDPKNQYEALKLVKTISKEQNIAVAIVIHDLNLALRYCDRFLFLKDSKIYSYGDIESMTTECIKNVYGMPSKIVEFDGVKMVIPFPDDK